MAKKNNNKKSKINLWVVFVIFSGIWITLFGWLINSQAKLANDINGKINEYEAQVATYQSALTEIHTKLGGIERDLIWIVGFLDPFQKDGSRDYINPYDYE